MENNVPYQLIAAYFNGLIEPVERAMLNKWLNEDKSHQAILDELEVIWKDSGSLSESFSPNAFTALAKVHQRIKPAKGLKRSLFSSNAIVFKVAAGISFLIVLAYFVKKLSAEKMLIAETKPNTRHEITLPDSSQVVLNYNSRLEYPENFNANERRLQLSGEALFMVTSNKKPFIIEAGYTLTSVLGTHFNLMAYPGSDSVVISLIEGKVEFSETGTGKKVVLEPAEKAIYLRSKNTIIVEKLSSKNVQWNIAYFDFDYTPLAQVCVDLSKHYGVHLSVTDSVVAKLRFNGRFSDQKLPAIIKTIEEAMGLTARANGKQVVFENTKSDF